MKQATLKDLQVAAAKRGVPQVRMTIEVVWPSGGKMSSRSGPPVSLLSIVETLRDVYGPTLRDHHGKRIVIVGMEECPEGALPHAAAE